jgi:exopolysaccharide biosynthesis polyprenyl glycosylphosphotransferase
MVIATTAGFGFLAMASWRQFRRRSLARAVADGLTCHNVVVIGTDSLAHALRDHLASQSHLGFVVLGLLSTGEPSSEAVPIAKSSYEIGTLDDLPRLCRTHFIDEIIICAQNRQIVKEIIAKAKEYGVGVRVVPDLYDGMAWGAHLDYLGAFPALGIVHRDLPTVEFKVKRLLDMTVSAIALTALSPLMLLIALLIKLDSRGSVFYVSQRVGKKGRIFSCYKFRTMVSDAEKLKAKLQHLNERDGILFKIRADPRITRVGRYLRKYSLDELAQLWNVLKGDMSLVGPRPPLAGEVHQYELEYFRRLEAAPGITGLWQVEARTSPSFEDYISLDLSYVNNWTLGLDLRILLRTVTVVFAGTGS